ncbi:MAG: fibronectin type III domain-containing protein, partial [Vallitalea sp.]|nr:fibronectin type III domain-containing protein [Vallitalea sp.]
KGKSYDFRLVVEGGSNAGSSNEIEVKTTNTISDFKDKDGETTNTTVVFTWTVAKEATSVNIQQKETGEEKWEKSETGEIGTNDNTATVTKLEKGKSYDFRLVVEGGSNAGSSNEIEVKTTNTISDFKDKEITNTTVVFTWTTPKDATKVKVIQRIKQGKKWKEWMDSNGEIKINKKESTVTVAGLVKKTYEFKLEVEGGENAGFSNTVKVTIK